MTITKAGRPGSPVGAKTRTAGGLQRLGRPGRCADTTTRTRSSSQGARSRTAKIVCQGCPVVAECLADALDNRIEFGVWGGMTERERRALLRRRPNVTPGVLLGPPGRLSRRLDDRLRSQVRGAPTPQSVARPVHA